jgi:small conductance mechanosensitive channel
MDITAWVTDDRLVINLIAIHAILGAIFLVSVVLRRVIMHGGSQLVRWTGLHWLDGVSKEAVRHVRSLLFWSTVALMVLAVISGSIYHVAGRDVREDVRTWYSQLTARDIVALAVALGELALVGVGMFFGLRLIRRGTPYLEHFALQHLPHRAHPDAAPVGATAAPERDEPQDSNDRTVKHWFHLLERLAVCTLFFTAILLAGHIVHLSVPVDMVVGFAIRMLAIVMVARLLVLACRTIFRALTELGNRHLGQGKLTRYWEQVTRLFPFGEKCFEAAVYISAASLCVAELSFLKVLAETTLGPRIVLCIGIFFITRVVIELSSVLLNEAFGMYAEDRPADQMGKTLVPLLQSICQYGLYFACALKMMSVMGMETQTILAGAGILGLACGFGAQNLVTDVVSGFFILFENQYLVGDIVQVCDAQGRVEAVSIRHTQVRDEQGKLYIIPNGQIKSVINFSKGFVNAVVDVKTPTTTPLHQVMNDMAEAGRRLHKARREVLAETVVKGLVDLSPADMTIRAVTRVQPGTHLAMQNEYRRFLKEVFDERQSKPAALAA